MIDHQGQIKVTLFTNDFFLSQKYFTFLNTYDGLQNRASEANYATYAHSLTPNYSLACIGFGPKLEEPFDRNLK